MPNADIWRSLPDPLTPKGIIDIIFAIGVNPMAQSSQSMLYNPLLMKCKTNQGAPSLSASLGAGFPAGFPMYNQHLHHYCYMDPEEAGGLLSFLLLSVSCSDFETDPLTCSSSPGGCVGVWSVCGFDSVCLGLLRLQDPQQDLAPWQSQYLVGWATHQDARGAGCTGLGEYLGVGYNLLNIGTLIALLLFW